MFVDGAARSRSGQTLWTVITARVDMLNDVHESPLLLTADEAATLLRTTRKGIIGNFEERSN